VLHLMKGTPYIYQGEEIGMTNVPFEQISDYRDIETLNMHRLNLEAGLSEENFIKGANENSRDNARTPMQWTDGPQAGFTEGTPWIAVNPNYRQINAKAALADENSVFHHHAKLIALRKSHDVIVYGSYQSFLDQHPDVFVYTRTLEGERVTVIASFSGKPLDLELPTELETTGEALVWNYGPVSEVCGSMTLQPYESFAVLTRG
jgi:oligo-1,6-glucosidase